jgi:hypothetical protein
MLGAKSNDTLRPKPVTEIDAKRWLDVDFPGLEIGIAEYAEGPTGCTVFAFGRTVSLHVDVRGGSPGVIGDGFPVIDAICLAGGSIYGLEASTGVTAELFARKGYSTQWNDIQLVAGGIIFDYGRPRATAGSFPARCARRRLPCDGGPRRDRRDRGPGRRSASGRGHAPRGVHRHQCVWRDRRSQRRRRTRKP